MMNLTLLTSQERLISCHWSTFLNFHRKLLNIHHINIFINTGLIGQQYPFALTFCCISILSLFLLVSSLGWIFTGCVICIVSGYLYRLPSFIMAWTRSPARIPTCRMLQECHSESLITLFCAFWSCWLVWYRGRCLGANELLDHVPALHCGTKCSFASAKSLFFCAP